ncbi:MAG TPA: hypothetical protein VMH26_18105, partial [Burkholderiales bacterium]|nr:hypothetical protein [Burkholderiales bacterium]
WMTADGKSALSGSRDKTLRAWDLDRAQVVHVFTGHTKGVHGIVITPDGGRAVSVARDRTIRLWDLSTGRALRALVSADEKSLPSGRTGSVLLDELEIGPVLDVADHPISGDSEIAIAPDGTRVVFGSGGSLCVWDLASGSTLREEVEDFDLVAIAIDSAAGFAVLGSRFGSLRVWDLAVGKTAHVLEGHAGAILDVVITSDGRTVVSASGDDTLRVWDIAAGRGREVLGGRSGKVDEVAIAPNGEIAYSIYGDTLVVSSLSNSSRHGSLSLDHQITALAVAPDGKRLALGDESGRVHFLRLEG